MILYSLAPQIEVAPKSSWAIDLKLALQVLEQKKLKEKMKQWDLEMAKQQAM